MKELEEKSKAFLQFSMSLVEKELDKLGYNKDNHEIKVYDDVSNDCARFEFYMFDGKEEIFVCRLEVRKDGIKLFRQEN